MEKYEVMLQKTEDFLVIVEANEEKLGKFKTLAIEELAIEQFNNGDYEEMGGVEVSGVSVNKIS